MAVGTRHADHVAPSIGKKLALTSLTSGSRSVGIDSSRTQATEFFVIFIIFFITAFNIQLRPELNGAAWSGLTRTHHERLVYHKSQFDFGGSGPKYVSLKRS
jgi:hypothetical protein